MSFFNRVLAGVGVGAAKVDAKLQHYKVRQGDMIEGIIEIVGGKIEQSIEGIYLAVCATYEKEIDDKKVEQSMEVDRYHLPNTFTIQPNERKEIPFSFPLPYKTPVTRRKTKVWVQTGLDIKMAIDPNDRDYLEVAPHPLLDSFLDSIRQLGFRSTSVETKKGRDGSIVQEFEFKPSGGPYRGRLDEIEFVYQLSSNQSLDVFLEIDRKARNIGSLLSEMIGTDETTIRFTISKADVADLTNQLAELIHKYS